MSAKVRSSNQMRLLAPSLRRHAADAIGKTARAMGAETKRNIVAKSLIDTGAMLNSVVALPLGMLHWRTQVGVEYAPYVEYGHMVRNQYGGPYGYVAPRPFFTPAVAAVAPMLVELMKRWRLQ